MIKLVISKAYCRKLARSSINIIGLIVLINSITSCEINSEVETRIADLEAFNRIVFNFPCEVYLNESSGYNITLVGEEEMLDNTEYKVEDSILYINNISSLNFVKPQSNIVELYINSKPLKRIDAEQTCNIQTVSPITSDYLLLVLKSKANSANLELNCKTFYYINGIPCGGKVFLRGKAENVIIRNVAIMSVDARSLETNNMDIINMSKGNCEVSAINTFKYGIEGTGDIHLYGSPDTIIVTDITSTGKLVRFE